MKLSTVTVYLVGRQHVETSELARFLDEHDVEHWSTDTSVGAERLVEVAGRVCYMSFARPRPGGNAAYVGRLLEVGHHSVLEHAVWNLLVTGISRACSHELVRHRHLSPSQLSQRYVDESAAEYVVPPALREEVRAAEALSRAMAYRADPAKLMPGYTAEKAAAGARWLNAVRQSHDAYVELVNYLAARDGAADTEGRKQARQAARSVLPNATETKVFLTGNGRALRHFLEKRASRHADREMRELACAVHEVLAREAPALFGDYRRVDLGDGTWEVETDKCPT